MSAQKCVVEGCDLEYDVVCSFSFYNVNTTSEEDGKRQEWIEGAMQEDSECLWRHVSLQLCGYHFELDSQGLWIDSPMLPELLTVKEPPPAIEPTEEDKKRGGRAVGFQGLFEKFIQKRPKVAEIIKLDHSYSMEKKKLPKPDVSRLNVRQLVDTLGYLSLKNLQRKQLWVVKVETDKAEASITQAEQVITKMADPKQIIEIIPSTTSTTTTPTESLPVIEETALPDTFIYEIAEEQEIGIDEVKEIPVQNKEWTVNIVPEEAKPKYAYIKHCHTGKKRRHFTADMSEITLQQGDFENYYILPDVDPSVGVEVTTSYSPERYLVGPAEYPHLLVEQRPKRRTAAAAKRKRANKQAKQIQIKTEDGTDWVVEGETAYDQSQIDRKGRTRRRNNKYMDYVL